MLDSQELKEVLSLDKEEKEKRIKRELKELDFDFELFKKYEKELIKKFDDLEVNLTYQMVKSKIPLIKNRARMQLDMIQAVISSQKEIRKKLIE